MELKNVIHLHDLLLLDPSPLVKNHWFKYFYVNHVHVHFANLVCLLNISANLLMLLATSKTAVL